MIQNDGITHKHPTQVIENMLENLVELVGIKPTTSSSRILNPIQDTVTPKKSKWHGWVAFIGVCSLFPAQRLRPSDTTRERPRRVGIEGLRDEIS